MLLSLTLAAVDIVTFFTRLYAFYTAPSKVSFKQFWRSVVLGHQDTYPCSSEYAGLVLEDPEDYNYIKPTSSHERHNSSLSEQIVFDADSARFSRHSDDTLRDIVITPIPRPKQPLLRRISQAAYATLERSLVFAAFGMVLSGVVIYTGGCRDSYINGCLAHLISKKEKKLCFCIVSLTPILRGWNILVLWVVHLRSFLGLALGDGLGVEYFADRKHHLGRICGIYRYLPLWNHQHMDGEIWGETGRPLHDQAGTTH